MTEPSLHYEPRRRVYRDEEGRAHRENGPAVLWNYGQEEHYLHGILHRIGGPAVHNLGGYRAYYEHGQLHRLDGPAIVHPYGSNEWWVRGIRLPDNPSPEDILLALL